MPSRTCGQDAGVKKPVTVPLILSVPSGNVWVTSIEHVRSWPCGFFFAAVLGRV